MDENVNVCFLTANEMYYEEYGEHTYPDLNKDLFIRKPIPNAEFLEKIDSILES